MAAITYDTGPQIHTAQIAQQLWHALQQLVPEAQAKQRPVVIQGPMGSAGATTPWMQAHVTNMPNDPYDRAIVLNKQAVNSAVNAKTPFPGQAPAGLIHEFAHYLQDPAVLSSVPMREGGAQEFARLLTTLMLRKSGVRGLPWMPPSDPNYQLWGNQARGLSQEWKMHGQFAPPGPNNPYPTYE